MAVLESCPKHNMVAYLEKTDGNAEFHEIIDFLAYITSKVASKLVSIFEASIRTKVKPSVHKDPLFDELVDDTLDYRDTDNAQDMGRTRFVVHEEKEREEKEVSIDDVLGTDKEKVSTDKEKFSTDKEKVSTDKEKDSTDKEKDSTDRPNEGTEGRIATPTTPT
ncbi:hypothetical protein Tco_1543062, partial [Tanacetum coccineum]